MWQNVEKVKCSEYFLNALYKLQNTLCVSVCVCLHLNFHNVHWQLTNIQRCEGLLHLHLSVHVSGSVGVRWWRASSTMKGLCWLLVWVTEPSRYWTWTPFPTFMFIKAHCSKTFCTRQWKQMFLIGQVQIVSPHKYFSFSFLMNTTPLICGWPIDV